MIISTDISLAEVLNRAIADKKIILVDKNREVYGRAVDVEWRYDTAFIITEEMTEDGDEIED